MRKIYCLLLIIGHQAALCESRCHGVFTARCTIVQSAVLQSHVVCLSVCPSVCDVGGSLPHRLKIFETNYTNNYSNIFALRSPKVIHLLPGEHEEISGRLEVGLALVRSFGTASATSLCLRRWIVPLLLDHTDIGSVLHNKSASRGHLRDSTASCPLCRLHQPTTIKLIPVWSNCTMISSPESSQPVRHPRPTSNCSRKFGTERRRQPPTPTAEISPI